VGAYQFLSRPFQSNVSKQEILQDAQVRELRYRLTELESQNQRIKELLKLKVSSNSSGTWAAVIGRGADSWWNQILISKGSNDGINTGAYVIAPGGLVGRVTHASPNSSQILLISDPNSQVGVVISRSRISGMLKGLSQNIATLEFFERDPPYSPKIFLLVGLNLLILISNLLLRQLSSSLLLWGYSIMSRYILLKRADNPINKKNARSQSPFIKKVFKLGSNHWFPDNLYFINVYQIPRNDLDGNCS